jgi:hypothetical protein
MTTTNTSMKLVLTLGFGRETVDSNLPVAEEHGTPQSTEYTEYRTHEEYRNTQSTVHTKSTGIHRVPYTRRVPEYTEYRTH